MIPTPCGSPLAKAARQELGDALACRRVLRHEMLAGMCPLLAPREQSGQPLALPLWPSHRVSGAARTAAKGQKGLTGWIISSLAPMMWREGGGSANGERP